MIWVIAIIIFLVWAFFAQRKVNQNQEASNVQSAAEAKKRLEDDEYTLSVAYDLEKRILKYPNLPDAINRSHAYIFRHLMKNWFTQLTAQNRYNDTISRKLRTDFLNYIELIDEFASNKFLHMMAFEKDDKKEEEKYERIIAIQREQIKGLELLFASMVSSTAVAELQLAHSHEGYWLFSTIGDKAPDGYKYNLFDQLEKA